MLEVRFFWMRQCFPSPILLINISYLLLKKHSFLPDSFLNNQNWAYLCINSLKFCTAGFHCMPSWGLWKYIETNPRTLALFAKFFKGLFIWMWTGPVRWASSPGWDDFYPTFIWNIPSQFNQQVYETCYNKQWHKDMQINDIIDAPPPPQAKRCTIITHKYGIHELPHELPNDPRLRIPGN